jgi:hypothetical protein
MNETRACGIGRMKMIRQNEWETKHLIHHKFHTDYLGLRTRRWEAGEELPEPWNDLHTLTAGIVQRGCGWSFISSVPLQTYLRTDTVIKVKAENAASNSGGHGFKYRPVDRLSLPRFFVFPAVRFGIYAVCQMSSRQLGRLRVKFTFLQSRVFQFSDSVRRSSNYFQDELSNRFSESGSVATCYL